MKKNTGIALVEIVIGSAIIAMAIVAASSAYLSYLNYAIANQKNVQASYLIQEGLETFIFFRDTSWSNISSLSTTTTYYLSWGGTTWATSTTPQYVGGEFLRSFLVEDVRRDGLDRIAGSGTYDARTKKVTATVEYYQGHGTTTRSVSTYIADLYNN